MSHPNGWGSAPAAGSGNTFVEEDGVAGSRGDRKGAGGGSHRIPDPVPLSQVAVTEEERLHTGIGELDRVLGRRYCGEVP